MVLDAEEPSRCEVETHLTYPADAGPHPLPHVGAVYSACRVAEKTLDDDETRLEVVFTDRAGLYPQPSGPGRLADDVAQPAELGLKIGAQVG